MSSSFLIVVRPSAPEQGSCFRCFSSYSFLRHVRTLLKVCHTCLQRKDFFPKSCFSLEIICIFCFYLYPVPSFSFWNQLQHHKHENQSNIWQEIDFTLQQNFHTKGVGGTTEKCLVYIMFHHWFICRFLTVLLGKAALKKSHLLKVT